MRNTYRDDYSRSQHSVEDEGHPTSSVGGGGGGGDTASSLDSPPPARTTSVPQSDPGASNRFAAYVNRFANVDPRMDYSAAGIPQQHGRQQTLLEEKKEDRYGMRPTKGNYATSKYHSSSRYHDHQHEGDHYSNNNNDDDHHHDHQMYPDPDFGMEQMLAAEHAYMRSRPPPSMAGSAATTTALQAISPGANRTRHLAKRFEERMQNAAAAAGTTMASKGTTSTSAYTVAPPPWHQETARYARDRSMERPAVAPLDTTTITANTTSPHPAPRSESMDDGSTSHRRPAATDNYLSRSEIETPSPARVSALKQKLWDESESLNVKVRPSSTRYNSNSSSNHEQPQHPMRNARSLSPKTSRRVYQHFTVTEPSLQQQHQPQPQPRSNVTPIRNPTHFEWTETRPRANSVDDRSHRDDRSRSSSIGRGDDNRSHHTMNTNNNANNNNNGTTNLRDDRSAHTRDDRSRSSVSESRRTGRGNQYTARGPDAYEGNGGELQNSPFFKSRFLEAAEKTVERRAPSLSRANSSSSSVERGPPQSSSSYQEPMTPSRYFQRQLEAAEAEEEGMRSQAGQQHVSTSSVGSGRNVSMARAHHYAAAPPPPPPPPSSAVGTNSYASTPIVGNHQENVAALLAKLHSVNRDDPSAALREIDAILKAQAAGSQAGVGSISNAATAAAIAAAAAPPMATPASPPEAEEDEGDGDSETETTVSSITNPTFSGHGKHRKKHHYHETRKTHHQSLPTTVEGEPSHHPHRSRRDTTDPTESRRKKVRSPPPDTIQVSGNRAGSTRKGDNTGPITNLSQRDDDADGARDKTAPYETTAELAEKIRRWDELSGKGSSPEIKTSEYTDTTEALGSIVTPLDGFPVKKKVSHPWDASIPTRRGKIDMRDTSMDNGAGVETKYSPHSPNKQQQQRSRHRQMANQDLRRDDERNNPFADESHNPFAQESDHDSNLGSYATRSREGAARVTQSTVMDMSNDFDDAWVTLPTSNFFSDTTPPRKSDGKPDEESRARSDESPPPPPVSAKKASVQKFSPKRYESSNRGMTYEPPSPGRRSRQSDAPRAFDEKPLDQAPSEEEYEDGIEVTLVGGKKEKRKGLRSLLQRRNSKSQPLGTSSVVSSTSRRRNQPHMAAYEAEVDPPSRSISRGRRRNGSPSRDRARSLEERRIRNPNIARKFSRLLRVYNDEERRPAEV